MGDNTDKEYLRIDGKLFKVIKVGKTIGERSKTTQKNLPVTITDEVPITITHEVPTAITDQVTIATPVRIETNISAGVAEKAPTTSSIPIQIQVPSTSRALIENQSQDSLLDLPVKITKNPRVQDIFDDQDLIYSIERRLLQEVFTRPPLYDSSLSLKDRATDVRIRLFKDISAILNDEFEQLRISWNVVSNTWNQHRTIYTRYVNGKTLTKSGMGRGRVPGLPMHSDILSAYDPVIEKRVQTSSLSNSGLSKFPPQKRYTKEDAVGKYLKTATDFIQTLSTSSTATIPEEEDVQATSTNYSHVPNLESADPNLVFFYSILPDMKKLKPKDERHFKKTIIDCIYGHLDSYENEDVQATSTTYSRVPNLASADPNLVFFYSILPDMKKLKPKDERNFKKTIIDFLYGHLDSYENEGQETHDANKLAYDGYYGMGGLDDDDEFT